MDNIVIPMIHLLGFKTKLLLCPNQTMGSYLQHTPIITFWLLKKIFTVINVDWIKLEIKHTKELSELRLRTFKQGQDRLDTSQSIEQITL